MLVALLLLTVATADLVRLLPRHARALLLLLALWAGETTLTVHGTGTPLHLALLAPAVALVWVTTTPWTERARTRPGLGARMLPIALLSVAVVALLIVDGRQPAPNGWLVAAIETALPPGLPIISATTAVLTIAITLLLTETSNRIVRATLPAPIAVAEQQADTRTQRPRIWRPRRRPETPPAGPAPEQMKGGRLIGPLERILIAGLLLTADFAVVAAIIAAKGIVRFPEISRGSGTGNAAEYFLVGSFVSWTIAFLAVGLLRLSLTATTTAPL